MAKPVYIALFAELSTAMIAWFAFRPGAQALMVPSRVAKRKGADQP